MASYDQISRATFASGVAKQKGSTAGGGRSGKPRDVTNWDEEEVEGQVNRTLMCLRGGEYWEQGLASQP